MIRAIVIYIVCALLFLMIAVQVSHRFMGPLEGLGKSFFYAVKTNEFNAAYQMCSKELRNKYSENQLINYLREVGLLSAVDSNWHTVQEKGNVARILGYVVLEDGRSIPIEIYAILESETRYPYIGDIGFIPFIGKMKIWKINYFVLPGLESRSSNN